MNQRKNNSTQAHCWNCKQYKDIVEFHPDKSRYDGIARECKECVRNRGKEKWQRLRRQVIELLGGSCIRCGFADERALHVDHVNGGGHRERKSMSTFAYYKKLLADIDSGQYQILCANCNFIKRAENGECRRAS